MLSNINSNSFNSFANFKNNIRNETNLSVGKMQNKDTSNEVLGYKVDKDGYLTEEFNEAARIPKDIKIHSSTIKYINEIMVENVPYFSSIDYPKTIGNAYQIFSQILDLSGMGEKTSFSNDDLEKFPEAFSYNENTKDVNQIFSFDEFKNMVDNRDFKDIPSGYYVQGIFFAEDSSIENFTAYDKNALKQDEYLNKDGSLTIGGLISAFVKDNIFQAIEGETTVFGKLSGADKNVNSEDFSKELQMMSLAYTGSIAIPDLGIWGAKDLDEARKMFIEWRKNHPEGDNNDIIKIMEKQVKDSSNFLKNLGKNIKIKKKLDIEV